MPLSEYSPVVLTLNCVDKQKGEIEFLKQEGIAVYEYDVSEYQQIVQLALANATIPASRLTFGEHKSSAEGAFEASDSATNDASKQKMQSFENPLDTEEDDEA